MNRRRYLLIAWLLLVASCLLGAHAVQRNNRRLASRIAEAERHHAALERRADEERRWREAATRAAAGDAAARDALHAEAARLRAQIADRERRAAAEHAVQTAQADRRNAAYATDGDPTHGFVRVDEFREQGQATPGAAFQTLVWAASAGNEAALSKLMHVPEAARTRAEALIASLPEAARATWTPEKLAALSIAATVAKVSALQITGETYVSPDQAVVTFRAPGMSDDERTKLKLAPSGWKVVVSSGAIAKLEKEIRAPQPARTP